jgi:O-Antigen ligase
LIRKLQDHLLVIGCLGMAASIYFPIGFAWFFLLLIVLASLFNTPKFFHHPLTWLCLGFVTWLLISGFVSNQSFSPKRSYFAVYLLVLLAPLIALKVPSALAYKTVRVFLSASVLAALIVLIDKLFHLPDAQIWRALIDYTGNKSISNLSLLALGSAMFLACGLAESDAAATNDTAHSFYPLGSALCAWVVLWTAQSRTALLLLPIAIIALLLREKFPLKTKIIVCLGASILTAGVILSSPIAAERIRQAVLGYTTTQVSDAQTNSMAVRSEMNKLSVELFTASPHFGQGLGSWEGAWEKRRQVSGAHTSTTAHNEYLGLAAQAGWPGLAFFISFIGLAFFWTWRGSHPWHSCGLIVCCAWVWASFFNATLRDAVFSLPLLFLLGITLAATRREPTPVPA